MSCTTCGDTLNIVTGYYNFITGKNTDLAKSRSQICRSCSRFRHSFCTACKCYLEAKIRVKEMKCPINKW